MSNNNNLLIDQATNEENTADILDLNHQDEFTDIDEYQKNSSRLSDQIEIKNDEVEEEEHFCENGILDEMTIRKGLSNLGKTPDGITYAMLTLNLIGYQLENVEILCQYPYLQEINLSHNIIQNIDFLQSMRNLISINISNNMLTNITETFTQQSANFLREIDFSFNQLESVPNFGCFLFLSTINFDRNNLTDLSAFAECFRLISLNVAHNRISSLEPIFNCPLRYLDASYNELTSLTGLEESYRLQQVLVTHNNITALTVFTDNHRALYKLDLEHNNIIDIEHLRHLQSLILLRDLNLRHNPITEVPDYRLLILLVLSKLTHLDGSKIEIEEKVKAQNIFTPSLEVQAARDHRINMVNRFFKAQTVLYSTLQNSYTPYPMLVLVGPKGSGKKWLARKLVQEIPNFFGLALSHTDQPRFSKLSLKNDDVDMIVLDDNALLSDKSNGSLGEEYCYVSTEEFDLLRMEGKFLETCQIDGYQYGLTVDAVEDIAREGLACVIDLELEGVASLKRTHFEPRYVLTMCLDRTVQESRIRAKAYSPVALDGIVRNAISRADMYLERHRNSPGYFDKFIATDDIEEAFLNLKRLVMDYLGITNEYVTDSRTIDANSRLASIGNLSQSRATVSQQKPSSGESLYTSRGGDGLEQKSLERRLNTARAAIFRKSQEDSMSAIKMLCRTRSYEAGFEYEYQAASNVNNQNDGIITQENEEEEENQDINGDVDLEYLSHHSSSNTNSSVSSKGSQPINVK